MKKQYGFTLLEAVIVIVITAIIANMVSIMMTNGFNIYFGEKSIIDANWQGRLALERMARDFRAIRSPTDISVINATQFTFIDFNNNTITYQLSGNTLVRSGQVLADGIGGLNFSYYDETPAVTATPANVRYILVTLNITQNNTNATYTTAIYGRNLI